MANIKSAKKRVLISERRRIIRKMYMSSLRTVIKKAMDSESSNREENIRIALKFLDRAVSKGVLHKNTAARKKSMLCAVSA